MAGMFGHTAIEDSGIANWNTASLTYATSMFFEAKHLSAGLDLSVPVVRVAVSLPDQHNRP
jgi:hypothetical protein